MQPDKSALGDSKLNEVENLARLKEQNAALTEKYKIHGQQELENEERSAGARLPYQEIIRRIRKCTMRFKVRDGSPGNVAFYMPKALEELEAEERDPNKDDFFNDHRYVGGMPKEPIAEYSHITLDERGLPKREIRGWRSVLITLIKPGVLTYRQAVKEFGEARGSRSSRWHEQLHKFKD